MKIKLLYSPILAISPLLILGLSGCVEEEPEYAGVIFVEEINGEYQSFIGWDSMREGDKPQEIIDILDHMISNNDAIDFVETTHVRLLEIELILARNMSDPDALTKNGYILKTQGRFFIVSMDLL